MKAESLIKIKFSAFSIIFRQILHNRDDRISKKEVNMLYKKISRIGKIVGYIICSLTIECIDLTDSFILNWCIVSPIITWCLMKLSYYTCNVIVYQKLNINESGIGSIGYWISYYIYVFIYNVWSTIYFKVK